jgi:hypothetical protein
MKKTFCDVCEREVKEGPHFPFTPEIKVVDPRTLAQVETKIKVELLNTRLDICLGCQIEAIVAEGLRLKLVKFEYPIERSSECLTSSD